MPPLAQYKDLKLFNTEHWHVGLHPKQTYLGRAVAIYQGHNYGDPLKIPMFAMNNLWYTALHRYKHMVYEAFSPDRINYAHLANDYREVHWHLIPRYEDPQHRSFADCFWVDYNPRKNYAPHPDMPKKCTWTVIQKIREELLKHD